MMCLWRVSMVILPLFLLRLCWLHLCAVLILHLHELLDLPLIEVLTEIPLPLRNLDLQTPRPLAFLSIALLRPRPLLLLPLAHAFLPRLST